MNLLIHVQQFIIRLQNLYEDGALRAKARYWKIIMFAKIGKFICRARARSRYWISSKPDKKCRRTRSTQNK